MKAARRLLKNSPPLGIHKSLACMFNPQVTQAQAKTILYLETRSYSTQNVEAVDTHLCSAKLLVLPRNSKHLQLLTCPFTCLFSSCLCIATYLITFFFFFFWDCKQNCCHHWHFEASHSIIRARCSFTEARAKEPQREYNHFAPPPLWKAANRST